MKHLFCEVCSDEISATIKLSKGQEIVFCCRDSQGRTIDKPILKYCNIKLAVTCAMNACGAADIIAKMYRDSDDNETIINQPLYMGGPFVSDNA